MLFTASDTLKNILIQLLVSDPVLFSTEAFFFSSHTVLIQSIILFHFHCHSYSSV